jgi:methylated-DNA-[protein]-cysteine S-methyltransferase
MSESKKNVVSVRSDSLCVSLHYSGRTLREVTISLVKDTACQADKVQAAPESAAVKEYFRGTDRFRGLQLDLSGYTEKEKKVLGLMRQIPFGKTLSYGDLARRAGNRDMARFVGSVCRKNRYPLIIPCHRVICSDGSLGGYYGGVKIKKILLEFEQSGMK